MTINLFRQNAIFDNLIVNQLCDELASQIANDKRFPETFLLTGAASYLLQRGTDSPVNNILFRVTDSKDYYILLEYLKQTPAKELMMYKNRTYFKYPSGQLDVFFMIVFEEDFRTQFVDFNNILIEDYKYIKPEFL